MDRRSTFTLKDGTQCSIAAKIIPENMYVVVKCFMDECDDCLPLEFKIVVESTYRRGGRVDEELACYLQYGRWEDEMIAYAESLSKFRPDSIPDPDVNEQLYMFRHFNMGAMMWIYRRSSQTFKYDNIEVPLYDIIVYMDEIEKLLC